MPHSSSCPPQTSQPVQQNSPSQPDLAGITVAGLFLLAFPVCLILGTYFYRKCYGAYRVAVRLRQIEYLEKLWQISPKQ